MADPSGTAASSDAGPVLDVRDLRTYFFTTRGIGKAVDGVTFALRAGETLGLVGESGSGKSMTCLSIMGLNPRPASRIVDGQILFRGVDLRALSNEEMRSYRGGRIAMILQDPMSALNPVLSIGEQIHESLRLLDPRPHDQELKRRAVELLRLLRIPAPETRTADYPHQFSGGMRQRVVGAIALSRDPEVIIADEPTTALDVTVQAAYLDLLRELQRRSRLAILFVTHDFGIVARICDRVAVMYGGRIVEEARTATFFSGPTHPYSEALLRSVPDVNAKPKRLDAIEGQPPSIFKLGAGCPFAARCAYVQERCWDNFPPQHRVAPDHTVSCWRFLP